MRLCCSRLLAVLHLHHLIPSFVISLGRARSSFVEGNQLRNHVLFIGIEEYMVVTRAAVDRVKETVEVVVVRIVNGFLHFNILNVLIRMVSWMGCTRGQSSEEIKQTRGELSPGAVAEIDFGISVLDVGLLGFATA